MANFTIKTKNWYTTIITIEGQFGKKKLEKLLTDFISSENNERRTRYCKKKEYCDCYDWSCASKGCWH